MREFGMLGKRHSTRRPRPTTGSLLAIFLAALAPAAASAEPDALRLAHRELVAAIQGPAMRVSGAPALCAARGLPGAPVERTDVKSWYFASGACSLDYEPDLLGVVTRATQGLERDFLRPQRVAEVAGAVDAALRALPLADDEAHRLDRLLLHSTAWELLFAVEKARQTLPMRELDALRCQTVELLRRSSFPDARRSALPSTLGKLGEIPEIAWLVEAIRSGDAEVVELLPPTDAHARLLHGRFTHRVFLSSADAGRRREVREFLEGEDYGVLGQLPLRFPDVVSVLVLYFNVLDEDLHIVPTDVVAFWQQYGFSGRLGLERDQFDQAEDTVRFVSVRFRRSYDGGEPVYAVLSEDEMSRSGFVDAMPPHMSAPVTTLRGACIKCHRRVVSSFHPEEEREVRFTAPLEVSGRELLLPAAVEIEMRIGAAASQCGGEDGG